MVRIIIGFVLILFDFSIGAENNIIGLLPDFVGFIFLFFGMKAEQDKCATFKQDKKYMIPFAIYGYGIYLGNLYGIIGEQNPYVICASAIVSMLTYVYTMFLVIRGIKHAEESYSVKIGSHRMTYIWKITAMCYFLENGTLLLSIGQLYMIFYLAGMVSRIVFIVYTTQAAIVYSERKRNNRL